MLGEIASELHVSDALSQAVLVDRGVEHVGADLMTELGHMGQ
jgi:hypothetical protein